MVRFVVSSAQDFAKHGESVIADSVVVLQGRLDYRGGDEANMIVDKVIPD